MSGGAESKIGVGGEEAAREGLKGVTFILLLPSVFFGVFIDAVASGDTSHLTAWKNSHGGGHGHGPAGH